MSLVSVVLGLVLVFSDFEFKIPMIVGLLFIVVVDLVIVKMGWGELLNRVNGFFYSCFIWWESI